MRLKGGYDIGLLFATLCLVALGIVMVTSASHSFVGGSFSSTLVFMKRQGLRAAVGLCVLLVFMKIPYNIYRRLSLWILITSFLLLIAIFVWGTKVRGANRWLSIFTFTVQPVEIAKLSLVIFLAAGITRLRDGLGDFRKGFMPLFGTALLMATLVAFQPNISNAVFIVFIAATMLFIGGCRLKHLLPFMFGLPAAAVPFLYRLPHVHGRVYAFLDKGQDLKGLNWHAEQSLIALGSGFIFGCGPGRGNQKYSFLPDAHTDFIYSIIGEELGLIGTLTVLVLFTFILRRTVRIAGMARNGFGYLLSIGIGIAIFSTAAINIAVSLGVVPIAGLPLPFISYGGSALVASLAGIGIVLNISSGEPGGEPRRPSRSRKRSTRKGYARRVRRDG